MNHPERLRVLVISPHFPPVNAPDMQRLRLSLPFYRSLGWEPIVLCVGEAWQDGVHEPELLTTFPPDITIERSPALSLRWTRWLGVRNLGLRCWLHFLFAGSRLIRRHRIDLVFFSNTQFVTFALGRIWRFLHGTPFVADLQDPWRTDYYSRPGSRPPPGGWKYQFARFTAWALEGWSLVRASGLISVSPRYLADVRRRHSQLQSVPGAAIPFGASQLDLAAAMKLDLPPRFPRDHGELHVLYTGAAGPIMPHAVRALFQGLRDFRQQQPGAAARLRIHFLGTSYAAPGESRATVLPLAAEFGLADLVIEQSHRLGHLESLRLQQAADVLLLPGSNDPAYSPSKLYPYFLARRPILALVYPDSVLQQLVSELGGAAVVTITENAAAEAPRRALAAFFARAVSGPIDDLLLPRNEAAFAGRFDAATTTRQQCGLFDAALAHARTNGGAST